MREDSTYELTAIPAQAKYAVAGDSTGLHHVDFNITRLYHKDKVSQGKVGQHRLQASLSLDDEDDYNCTIAIDGRHRNDYADGWKPLKITHGFGIGPVVGLDGGRLRAAEITQTIGRTYRPIPAKAGGLRFMNAVTFHESTDSATKTRHVPFPWYTRVDTVVDENGYVSRTFETDVLEWVEY